jgi:hypothetical protein
MFEMYQFENVPIRVSSIITIRTQIEEIKEIIYDIRGTMFEMYQFENVTIRVSSTTRSPLEIEDSTIPKNNKN